MKNDKSFTEFKSKVWQPNNWQLALIFAFAFILCGFMTMKAKDNIDEARLHRKQIIACHDMQIQYDMIMKYGSDIEKIETIYEKNPSQCYYMIGEDDPFSDEWKNVETNEDFDRVYHEIDARVMKKVIDADN